MPMKYDRCPNCMKELQGEETNCPFCGFDVNGYEERSNCLRPFTVLENKYMIGRVIGVGGFGITYIGWDLNLQTYIAIKEYFPDSIASRDTSTSVETTVTLPTGDKRELYDKGLKRYVEEAQNISRFYQLPGIVSVKDFFYANDTAYIVMEYINGVNLKEYLNNSGGRLDEGTVLALMKPVFESLYQVHNGGLVHRDISPDNIMVDSDGKIKLIDFGSARGQSAETDKTYTVILKHGYAPAEQYYAKGNQGPWTDIYSLCASMYKMLTGQIPPNSVERMENDEYVNPSAWGVQVSPRTEAVLRKGLAVKVSDRYQNIGELLADLYGIQVAPSGSGVPSAANAAFANPASMSQQSMHLSMQPATTQPKKDNKKTMIIAISAIAAVVIIAILLIVFSGKNDKDKGKDTTEGTTEGVTTEDGMTEAPSTDEFVDTEDGNTEEPSASYTYVWPSELSGDWHDYQMNINGTIYQFPIPYSEWKSMGWKSERLPSTIAANDYEYITFYNDGVKECDTIIYNYTLQEADLSECFVIGAAIDFEDIDEGIIVELAGGVRLGESSENDVKAVFGAPDYRYTGDDYVSLDYAGDEYLDGADFKFSLEDKLINAKIGNTAPPAGYQIALDIPLDPPAINDKYVAPAGPSTDRFDSIITLDGANYVLPVPVSELMANGWSLDSTTDSYISGYGYTSTEMEKSGSKIRVTLENFTSDAMLPQNAYITSIKLDMDYYTLDALLPGNLSASSTSDDLKALYSDLGDDYSTNEYSTFISHNVYYRPEGDEGYPITLYIYTDPETGLLTDITYALSIYEMD